MVWRGRRMLSAGDTADGHSDVRCSHLSLPCSQPRCCGQEDPSSGMPVLGVHQNQPGTFQPQPVHQNPEPKVMPLVSKPKVIAQRNTCKPLLVIQALCDFGFTPNQPSAPHPYFIHPKLPLAPGSHTSLVLNNFLAAGKTSPHAPHLTNSYSLSKAPLKGHILCEALPDCSHSHTPIPHSSSVPIALFCGVLMPVSPLDQWLLEGQGPNTE